MTFALLLRETVEPMPDVARMTLEPLLERLEQARVILIGGATYGSSECNRLRGRLTRELIRHSGVTSIALAGGAADAWWLDRFVRTPKGDTLWPPPLSGFPNWIWRNGETFGFLRWLQEHNEEVRPEHKVEIRGLDPFDFYDTATSILECVEREVPAAARQVRARLACISPCLGDPAANGEMTYPAELGRTESTMLALVRRRLDRRLRLARRDAERDSERNPELSAAGAADFLKQLYQGSASSWAARQKKMFETLIAIVRRKDIDGKVVVWAHNADIGDASATRSGFPSLGQLCRAHLGDDVRLVGFGVAGGSLTAADTWGAPARPMPLQAAHAESYENAFRAALLPAFVLALRDPVHGEVREALSAPRLQRAVGPVYQPQTELASHYFQVSLPDQFDEYVWFNEGHPIMPVPEHSSR